MQVIEEIKPDVFFKWLKTADSPKDVWNGWKVNTCSNRLKLFGKSLKCVKCGVFGKIIRLERHNDSETPHFNLYAIKDGKYILMTKDHIVPTSRNGVNHMSNFQVMCTDCNRQKGNKLESEILEIEGDVV